MIEDVLLLKEEVFFNMEGRAGIEYGNNGIRRFFGFIKVIPVV